MPRIFSAAILALLLSALTIVIPAAPASANPAAPVELDLTQISNTPARGHWGVTGLDPNRLTNYENVVWDFAQIGDRIYVGGAFLNVQEWSGGTAYSQPYLAAFDLYTGVWDPAFQPVLDGTVYALEVGPGGELLIGGEFTSVDGAVDTAGLAALDPITGDHDPSWVGSVERRWTTTRAVVRAFALDGDDLYVAGNFNHIRGATEADTSRVYRAARFDAVTGTPDPTFLPQITGSGAWGMDVDPANGLVHLAGLFDAVNGVPGSNDFWTVDMATGGEVSYTPLDRNTIGQMDMFDVAVAGGKVWAGGAEHILHVLDAATGTELGWHTAGLEASDNRNWVNRTRVLGGGDYQVVKEVGNYVFGGCHCPYEERWGAFSHYSSFQQARFPTLLLEAYDTATGDLVPSFIPDLGASIEGVWAVHADSLGCLLVGGDFELGGLKTGAAYWLGNFARFCPPGIEFGSDSQSPTAPSNLQATVSGSSVQLDWNAASDNRGVTGYVILRDTVEVDTVDGATLTYTDTTATAGYHDYMIKAVDAAGNRSGNSNVVSPLVGGAAGPPSTPTNLTGTVSGTTVTLDWDDSTDDTGIAGYNVFRDGGWVKWVTTSEWVDTDVTPGTHTYRVRAYDTALNASANSQTISVTVSNGAGFACSVTANANGSVTVAWDDLGANGYDLIEDGGTARWITSSSAADFTPGTDYTVRAWGNGQSGQSTSCTNPNPGGGGFSCSTTVNIDGSVTLSWTGIGANGYDVSVDNGPARWVVGTITTVNPAGASYQVTAWGNGTSGTSTTC